MAAKKEVKQEPVQKPGYVTINLPVGRDKSQRGPLKVWSNGVGYSVPRGVNVDVPISVADVIRTTEKEVMHAADYLDEK